MTGMNIIIRCCAGSALVGVIFCCQNIVTPISTGSTIVRDRAVDRSWIQPTNGAPRSSIDSDSSE